MTILQTLIQLRDDIKLWCINNFSSINKKITANVESIEGVQTELSNKAALNHNHNSEDIVSGTLSSDRLPIVPVSKGGTGCSTYRQARAKINNFDLHCVRTLNTPISSDLPYVWKITPISSANYANTFLMVIEDPDGNILGAGTYILGSMGVACGPYTVYIGNPTETVSLVASGGNVEDYIGSGAGEGGNGVWAVMVLEQNSLSNGNIMGDFLTDSGYSLNFYEMGFVPGI